MKFLIISVLIFLCSFSIKAQEERQAKYVLKTNLLNLEAGNFKLGLDIATSTRATWEIQGGVLISRIVTSAPLNFRPHSHLLIRYKYDIFPDDKNLAGIYVAPGMDGGQWRIRDVEQGNPVYLNAFTDLGIQANLGILNVEIFGGIGYTWLDGAQFSDSNDLCLGCEYTITQNGINYGPLVLRLGTRMGINF